MNSWYKYINDYGTIESTLTTKTEKIKTWKQCEQIILQPNHERILSSTWFLKSKKYHDTHSGWALQLVTWLGLTAFTDLNGNFNRCCSKSSGFPQRPTGSFVKPSTSCWKIPGKNSLSIYNRRLSWHLLSRKISWC